MALGTLLGHLAAGRFGRVRELTGAATAAAAHRVLHLLLRTAPLPPLPDLVALARWSLAHFRAPLPLRLHALLLARLASHDGLQPLLRSELHALAAARIHSPASILRSLPSSSSASAPLIADMLVLELARATQPLAAYDAFLLAGDNHPRHRPSAFSVNALLAALVGAKRVDLAEKAFRSALRRHLSPDIFTFNTVISGLCRVGQLRKAGDVAKDIRAWGLAPSVDTYNSLIDGYCNRGGAENMYHVDMLLKEMIETGILPSAVTFNMLINGYCKNSNTAAAVRVFEEMKQQGMAASVMAYNLLISGLCNEGKLEEGMKLVEEMENLGLAPNVATFGCVLNGFCMNGMMEDGKDWIDGMSERNVKPNVVIYNILIDGYRRLGKMEDAMAVKEAMAKKGISPNVRTYNCLLTGFSCNGDWRSASGLMDEMKEKGIEADIDETLKVGLEPNYLTYNTIIDKMAVPSHHSTSQIQLPQTFHCSNANPLGDCFHIDMVDSDLWPSSFNLSMSLTPKNMCPDDFQEHGDEEVHDSEDEIDDMRHRKKLFYKLDRGSKEFEENNVSLHRRWKREKVNAKNPKECKKVDLEKSASLKVQKLKTKCTDREDMPQILLNGRGALGNMDTGGAYGVVEAKRDRVPTFNQMTDPYHHPFCLDIHVSKGSVRACFVHRVTSRVVAVAHSISKDMKFDLGSRKGMKACAAVGALLAKRAIEDDIHNAVYTPRKGDRIEGKIEIVLRAIVDNGVNVKVKLKLPRPTKISES
ncbi:hypothetical protein ABZP36_010907 [Zizania latifolia]